MWRVTEVFEGAIEQFVDFPVNLLAFGAAVVYVLAAGAELARFGANGTLVVDGCHDFVSYRLTAMVV
jgi:hypothetical protein